MTSGMYAARLHEYAQKRRMIVTYDDVGSSGPDHSRIFIQRAVLNGEPYPEGEGKSKKEARQEAARRALIELKIEETDPIDHSQTPVDNHPPPVIQKRISQPNYVCWLNEYSQKMRVHIKAKESAKLEATTVFQCCAFVVDDKEYGTAYRNTKKEAKEEAARLVHDEICGGTIEQDNSHQLNEEKEDLKQSTVDTIEKSKNTNVDLEQNPSEINYIGLLNNHCQKLNRIPDFKFVNRCGPPHNPEFIYKVIIEGKEYPQGVGKSAKDAKQNAAQLAVVMIKQQSNSDSKVSGMSTSFEDSSSSKDSSASPRSSLGSFTTTHSTTSISYSNSIVFTGSSSSPGGQIPDVKCKIRLAPNFPSPAEKAPSARSKHPESRGKDKSNSPNKENITQTTSRFLSEFGSITEIGKGGFGIVLKARRNLDNRFFAVKIVHSKEKALREIGALTDLQHENIVRYYTSWKENTNYNFDSSTQTSSSSQSSTDSPRQYLYIQMELCENGTLRKWIDEMNDLLENHKRRKESRSVMQEIINGVDYVHSNKLFHRDLKPVNILFGKKDKVKIGDFGLVTAEDDDNKEFHIERTECTGTPSYMAPEQKSQKNYDRKVDIFALGLIYFELLWRLGSKSERAAIWQQIRSEVLPPEFSQKFPEEHKLIRSMLCKRPENRPEAREVKTILEKCNDTIQEELIGYTHKTV